MVTVPLDGFPNTTHRFFHRFGFLRQLYVQVLLATVIGILVGEIFPNIAVTLKPLGDAFIMLIRAVVPAVIFCTVVVGIGKMGNMRRVGVVGLRALIYFEIVSTIALIVGLGIGNLFPAGSG